MTHLEIGRTEISDGGPISKFFVVEFERVTLSHAHGRVVLRQMNRPNLL